MAVRLKAKKVQVTKSAPLPGVITKKTWNITEGDKPKTVRRSSSMRVPLGVTPDERRVRNLEMARVKFTPANPRLGPTIDPDIYELVETCRVMRRAENVGVEVIDFDRTTNEHAPTATSWKEWFEQIDDTMDAIGKASEIAATMLEVYSGKGDRDRVNGSDWYKEHHEFWNYFWVGFEYAKSAADDADDEDKVEVLDLFEDAYDRMYNAFYRANAGHAATLEVAERLTTRVNPPLPPPEDEAFTQSAPSGKPQSQGALSENTTQEVVNSMDRDHMDSLAAALRKEGERAQASYMSGDGEEGKPTTKADLTGWSFLDEPAPDWGNMVVLDKLPMPKRLKGRMRAPGLVPQDRGSIFKYYQNYTTNGAVFAGRNIKYGGAAILIDDSGSMGFTANDIEAIVTMLPGAIIGVYAGDYGKGELRIVARNGKWCAKEHLASRFGGNEVDGPALRWLAKQKGPRIWVSDAGVGSYNGSYYEQGAECAGLCVRHHILRLDGIRECRNYIESHRNLVVSR